MAARPRSTSRGTWSPGRARRQRARNARTKRRRGSVACDICPAVLFHAGGPEVSGGDTFDRPSHSGNMTLVFAIPKQTDARTSSQRSRHYCGVAILTSPAGSTTHGDRARRGPNICTKRHFGVVASVIFPAGATMYGEIPPFGEGGLEVNPQTPACSRRIAGGGALYVSLPPPRFLGGRDKKTPDQ